MKNMKNMKNNKQISKLKLSIMYKIVVGGWFLSFFSEIPTSNGYCQTVPPRIK